MDADAKPSPAEAPGSLAATALGLVAFCVAAAVSVVRLPSAWDALTHDPRFSALWAREHFRWADGALDTSALSPVQGVGGLLPPLAMHLHPGFLLGHLASPALDARVVGSCVMTALFALCAYALGRAMGLSRGWALAGAQVLGTATFPAYLWLRARTGMNGPHLYAIPENALPTCCGMLALALFLRLGDGPRNADLARAAGVAALALYATLVDALFAGVFCLPVALVGLVLLAAGPTSAARRWRLGAAAAAALLLLLAGGAGFLRGLFGYMARTRFPDELYVEPQRWDYLTSLATQSPFWLALSALHVAGLVLLLRRADRQGKALAGAVLGFVVVMQVLSVLYVKSGWRWRPPLPSYFEVGAQPLYLLTGLLALREVGGRWRPPASWTRRPGLAAALAGLLLPMALLVTADLRRTPDPLAAPPGPLAADLRRALAIDGPGAPFRGSVVTVVGVPGDPLATKLELPGAAYGRLHVAAGDQFLRRVDPHLTRAGLWQASVPTLEDYSHLVSPPVHFLFTRALAREGDHHSRNWTAVTRARPGLLAALGARFLLTDAAPVDSRLALRRTQGDPSAVALRLYELREPNLGQYSPTRLRLVPDAGQAVRLLRDDAFDARREALVHAPEDVVEGLAPAVEAVMSFERGGVRVRARSPGRSLLVLPLQFSNALRVVEGGPGPRLLRVDLLLTGVLFEGRVDARLQLVFGLLRGSAGRRADIADCERLGVRQTGEVAYPPGFQPEAWRR